MAWPSALASIQASTLATKRLSYNPRFAVLTGWLLSSSIGKRGRPSQPSCLASAGSDSVAASDGDQ
jgi:hypothetical protein